MNNKALLGLSLIALSVSAGQAAMAAEEKAEGFIEGSSQASSIEISTSTVIFAKASPAVLETATRKNGPTES